MSIRHLIAPFALIAVPASAQLMPPLSTLPTPGRMVQTLGDTVGTTLNDARSLAPRALEAARLDRIARLVRGSGGRIALDDAGAPARSGEVVLNDIDDRGIAALTARGYRIIAREEIDGLGIGYVRLATPPGLRLDRALTLARSVAGDVAADVLYFQSGRAGASPGGAAAPADAPPGGADITIGIIDGGIGAGVAGRPRQSGFAAGAPRASDHGTAVASLIAGGGPVRGAAPGATVVAADVYGSDPAGGNAVAIARAIGWLTREGVRIVSISLVGPRHPLIARTVAAAQARGVRFVAAVGNDGPAAPPAYPASYPGVIAATGVDGRGRALIEAGRLPPTAYAAPGADMLALNARGRAVQVRGTSYAAPLVATAIAHAGGDPARMPVRDAGKSGVDSAYGWGLVCADCATRR